MKVDNVTPLLDAVSQLSQVFHEADVQFASTVFSIVASNPYVDFIIALHIRAPHFTEYSIHHYQSWRISLHSLHQAMRAGRNSSRMTIRLPPISTNRSSMILTFFSPNSQPLVREVNLSPSREAELERIDFVNYFSIYSKDLKRVIIGLSLIDDASVFVTLTNSQVRFVAALDEEIILTKEDGECEIVGYEGEFKIQFQISLFPMGLILNLIRDIPQIFFSKTESHAVMTVPAFQSSAQYMLYFPQIAQCFADE